MNESPVNFHPSENSFRSISSSESSEKLFIDQLDILTEKVQPLIVLLAILYVITIFSLKNKLQTRAAYSLRTPLILWNFFMALLSLLFAYQFAIHLAMRISDRGLVNGIFFQGNRTNYDIWVILFGWSKIIELVDTLFIVLRKRPLILLHWSHHAITVIYGFFAFREIYVLPTVWMNSSIHTAMYTYYGLRAMGVNVSRKLAMSLTGAQIVQMIISMIITIMAICFRYQGFIDGSSYFNDVYAILTYAYYTVMFSKFFLGTYVNREGKRSKTD
ncbi:very long chain fatty acid elongase 6-like [Brevipalpus obovatus]|uniref:very long chain fatty acid elongase 6-like n=1 Tax=Brevipalpus obovatus TaxID=246614 RepID=UPI003D9F2C03